MRILIEIFAALLGLSLSSYFLVSIVTEGSTAVRLRSGVLSDETVEAGWHWDIPGLYALRMNRDAFQMRIETLKIPAISEIRNTDQPIIAMWYVTDGRQYFKSMQANNPVDDRAISDAKINAKLQQRLAIELTKYLKEQPLSLTENDWQELTKQIGQSMFTDYGVRLVSLKPK